MPKILAVFGATGHQGSSVINYVLNDTQLSQEYKIRAITRDVNSEKLKHLAEKVEIVYGDVLDRSSISTALKCTHTIFAMTTPTFGPDAISTEYNAAVTIADVALQVGASYIIFSTLPSISSISGGKYTAVTPFDAKAKAEKYIRGLPIKSAFFAGGFFMENLYSMPFLAPKKADDGTWVLSRPISSKTLFPYLDAVGDTGKFVGAILAEPNKYEGKTFCAAAGLYSLEEIVALLSKATGKTVVYKQVSLEEFRSSLPFPPEMSSFVDIFVQGFQAQEEFGYFGPRQKEAVAWAKQNARGRLTTLEEYLEVHPLQLE